MKSNEKNEVGNALEEATYAYRTENEKVQVYRTHAWDTAGDVWRTEQMALKVVRSTEQPFSLMCNKFSNRKFIKPTKLGSLIINSLKTDVDAVSKCYPMHTLNPYIKLYFEQASKRQLFGLPWDLHVLTDEECHARLDDLNDFVKEVRQIGCSADFKKIIGDFERASNKNYRELGKFLDAHFELYSRLLVLRIDLGYEKPKDWPDKLGDDVTYADVKAHRLALVRHLKNGLPPKSFINYALKLEFGLDKHWHYHLLVLLDGSVVREDVTIAMLIGEHWKKTITKGQGLYWNCNGSKESYKCCGIGMLNHYDTDARQGLKKAALYITKTDYYVSLQVPGKDRIFWKGNLPKAKTTSVGRPRTRVYEQPGLSAAGA